MNVYTLFVIAKVTQNSISRWMDKLIVLLIEWLIHAKNMDGSQDSYAEWKPDQKEVYTLWFHLYY